MSKNEGNDVELVVDTRALLLALLKRAWLILIVGVICGVAALVYTVFAVTPKYSSRVMLYVNNTTEIGNVSISAADLSASQSLIDTYIVILKNRTTMQGVAQKLQEEPKYETKQQYTWGQLLSMISTGEYEGTEVFYVTVTCDDPDDAAKIANALSEVLRERIADVIDGSSMRVVDSAIPNATKVSPNVTSSVLVAFLIGCAAVALVIVIYVIFDDTIRTEEHLTSTYDIPILARIPDLNADPSKARYGYEPYDSKHTGDKL